jgi:hypothetical protein
LGFILSCKSIGLTDLCFADDLFIVSAATTESIQVIQGVLSEFEELSGLRANPAKSAFFSSRISDVDKKNFLEVLQMAEGILPVRYLGVPLIS